MHIAQVVVEKTREAITQRNNYPTSFHIVQVSLASNIYPCFRFLHKTDLFFFTILTIFLFPQGSRLNCYSIYTLPYLLLAVVLTSLDTCHAPFFPHSFHYFPFFFLCLNNLLYI